MAGAVEREVSVTVHEPLEITGVVATVPWVAELSTIEVLMGGSTTPSVPVQATVTGKLAPVRSTGGTLAGQTTSLERFN
ncbi:hypothetical protein D3C71_1816840 [compost metagenome]